MPGTDKNIGARIEQTLLGNSEVGQFRQVHGIDLHAADIGRAIFVDPDSGVAAAVFLDGDGTQYAGMHALPGGGSIKTVSAGMEADAEQQKQE